MTETPNLALPLIAAAQAQKHVTHNEALLAIDALLQGAVLDKDLSTPPGSAEEGDRYIVGGAPTGAWSGEAGALAAWQDGVWRFYAPRAGFLVFVADEGVPYLHDGTGWGPLPAGSGALQSLTRLGIGTTADAANPVTAKLNNALWTARSIAEGGTGDLRYVMNKEGATRVLSLLLQSGYSGRLEIGLVGDDATSIKVSPDGSSWKTALRIDNLSGAVDLMAPAASVPSAATCDLGAAPALLVRVTGSSTITSLGTRPDCLRLLTFSGSPTLTHDAVSLALPGGRDILTAPGDCATATSDGLGRWQLRDYARADGTSLVASAGQVVGCSRASSASFLDVTAQVPIDDTVPQLSETALVATVSHTPRSPANLLHVRARLVGQLSGPGSAVAAIFKGSDTDASAASLATGGAGDLTQVAVDHWLTAGSASPITFALRGGSDAPHLYVNGRSGGRVLGGAVAASIEVTEIAV